MKLNLSFENTRYVQYLASVIATMSIATTAMYTSWASPVIPFLKSDDSPVGPISKETGSWVASSFMFGTIPGGVLTGLVVEKLGRRSILLICAIPMFIPWIVCVFAKSAMVLIVSRVVAGLGGAIATSVVPMYIGEIADTDIRGKLGTAYNILKLLGSLFVLSVGPFVSYTVLTLSCSVLPLAFLILFYFMPESPYYLVKVNKMDDAEKHFIKLAPNNINKKETEDRLSKIANTVEYDMKNKSTLWEFLSKQEYRKALIITFGIKTLQQFSGMNAIDAYIQTIIGLSGSSISPEISSIICGVIQIPAGLAASFLVDKMGRKPLMLISALGCAVALIAEGAYFYLQDALKADVSSLSWLPTTGLVVYLVLNPIGLFTLPYVLAGEIYPTNVKGVAGAVNTVYGGALAFLVIKFFEPISDAWGMYTMFWLFAACCILGSVFVIFMLPETKGKTFDEIQAKLNRRRGEHSNQAV